jgi:hypothetical protein
MGRRQRASSPSGPHRRGGPTPVRRTPACMRRDHGVPRRRCQASPEAAAPVAAPAPRRRSLRRLHRVGGGVGSGGEAVRSAVDEAGLLRDSRGALPRRRPSLSRSELHGVVNGAVQVTGRSCASETFLCLVALLAATPCARKSVGWYEPEYVASDDIVEDAVQHRTRVSRNG